MSEELNFDLQTIEIPVTIDGKKYILREADEETAEQFQNARIAGTRIEDGKVVGLPTDLAGVQSFLVARCLFPVGDNGVAQKPLSPAIVKRWPSRVVKPLFERAKKISELDEVETLEDLEKQRQDIEEKIAKLQQDAAKNALDDTTAGSE